MGSQMEEARLKKRAHVRQYADYRLIMNLRSERFSGFLWDVSDLGVGALFAMRGGSMDFINAGDPIYGFVVNYKLGVKLDYEGHVKWKKLFELESIPYLHLGVQFMETIDLPDVLYGISFPAKARTSVPLHVEFCNALP